MMPKFEVLCVTMHQKDFSKVQEMNLHSNVFFANQADRTGLEEMEFEGCRARMLTTDTRGVGINRNMTLQYAQGDICLFADDDIAYYDDMERKILDEFAAHPDADIIIFHLDTDSERKQRSYSRTQKCGRFSRMPWGAVRVAFRLNAVRKANVWFTTLFGGGCVFPSGEDSMWLKDAKKKGLSFYVSKQTIGRISMEDSSWFTGYNEKFFFGKGAWCCAMHNRSLGAWIVYYAWRYRKNGTLSFREKTQWMHIGAEGYSQLRGYDHYMRG